MFGVFSVVSKHIAPKPVWKRLDLRSYQSSWGTSGSRYLQETGEWKVVFKVWSWTCVFRVALNIWKHVHVSEWRWSLSISPYPRSQLRCAELCNVVARPLSRTRWLWSRALKTRLACYQDLLLAGLLDSLVFPWNKRGIAIEINLESSRDKIDDWTIRLERIWSLTSLEAQSSFTCFVNNQSASMQMIKDPNDWWKESCIYLIILRDWDWKNSL